MEETPALFLTSGKRVSGVHVKTYKTVDFNRLF
jgi:hypothetical protein